MPVAHKTVPNPKCKRSRDFHVFTASYIFEHVTLSPLVKHEPRPAVDRIYDTADVFLSDKVWRNLF